MAHKILDNMLDELKTVVKQHVGDSADVQIDIRYLEGGRKALRITIPDISTLEIEFNRRSDRA
ncbi:hypothetical protein SOV92_00620 [Pectobacterium brasiliense]|uniref:Uncharacterized protein n=1 Tax=Pectobacterium brasiliense TaxID=180957 RepID=A0AAE2WB25_9GAMM|nr:MULTISPECIES: hypothetical protein [Pectobacterium]MBA0218258.1 hypothetical protein [Pectobacterium brasiliense]MBN3049962.1 hypothetical protein [Pectobacterium brasiliense]MBN3072169.1 hypothetical protein [Pectobacterium brasiliense]MBN3171163.1 hypothetical protein [Pectobacterium brasiliense]MDY4376351.1 hypothetical protein [Pectobacterium brasiliense]